MPEKLPPLKEQREIFIPIGDDYLVILSLSLPELGIRKVQVEKIAKSKEEVLTRETLITAGVKFNIPEMLLLIKNIGEERLENILRLALIQLRPNIAKEFTTVIKKTSLLAEKQKIIQPKPLETKKEKHDLKELRKLIIDGIAKIIERSKILEKSSKEEMVNLIERLQKETFIEIDSKTKEALNETVNVLIFFKNLGNLPEVSNNQKAKNIVKDLLKRGFIPSNHLKQILEKIRDNKQKEALEMLIDKIANAINNHLEQKKLNLSSEIQNKYLRPTIAILADYIVENLSFSRSSLTNLLEAT